MATDYRKRIKIPHDGSEDMKLFSESGELVATGYIRVVFGGRGPYIEFSKKQMNGDALYVPKDLQWKFDEEQVGKICYYEFRTKEDYVKVYFQQKTVDYADYKVRKFYISPFDLYDNDGVVLIEKLRKKKK